MTSAPTFSVFFSHPAYYGGQSQKVVENLKSEAEAITIASDKSQYPSEYPDFDRMRIIINNYATGESYNWNELPKD